ncbi:MAG TPA: fumarylacetoacetate hydrolase family protein [Nitrososphaerales archaeon]|nr:fumarylacetoacetate hydrolase family protein [Nitrososphaerales archaeon]
MKLANFRFGGTVRPGLVLHDMVFDVAEVSSAMSRVSNIDDMLRMGLLETLHEESAAGLHGVQVKEAKFLSPVLNPDKILLAAVNYASHRREQSAGERTEPYLFTKFGSCLVGQDDPVVLPRVSKKMDWEVELAVIIGRKGKYVPKEKAMEYVAGYSVANDISFRDLQFPPGWPERLNPLGQNWVKGKMLDTALPLGPCLVSSSEIPDPYDLDMTLKVNGVERQRANTGDMISRIDRLIEYASDGVTLLPGDVISTGTPAGVAVFSGAPFLKAGDRIEAWIEGIGTLRNTVIGETA